MAMVWNDYVSHYVSHYVMTCYDVVLKTLTSLMNFEKVVSVQSSTTVQQTIAVCLPFFLQSYT